MTMPPTDTNGSIGFPTTKQPIPPRYRGLPESATLARLASRPDRIDPEARAFFESWVVDSGIAFRRKDGRLVMRRELAPIGTARFFDDDDTTEAPSTPPAAAAAAKK
jgi:hypothetical protein